MQQQRNKNINIYKKEVGTYFEREQAIKYKYIMYSYKIKIRVRFNYVRYGQSVNSFKYEKCMQL